MHKEQIPLLLKILCNSPESSGERTRRGKGERGREGLGRVGARAKRACRGNKSRIRKRKSRWRSRRRNRRSNRRACRRNRI